MEPFTALVYKRTLPFLEITNHDGTKDKDTIHGGIRSTGYGHIIEISPNQRLMNFSNELGYPRSMPRPLRVFGTYQNYSEWLFRLAIIESIGRESRGNFVPTDISIDIIAKLCGYQLDNHNFLPNTGLATTILAYSDQGLQEWRSYSTRMEV